ncbi:MAG TPA: diacylglycerol kinase family protein [Burkholderiales bacterium]|nr:diacylglycerol kinase family protein [Burkholderiales bacterium]
MQIRLGLRVLETPETETLSSVVPVVCNCTAGGGRSAADVERAFEGTGIEARVVPLDGGDPREAALEALKSKPPVLVAAGGDGTISAVADAVRGTGTALGVLPVGTLNHFAKDLGIPLDPAEAALVIAAGKRMAVDVGEVNGRCFINNASLGLYPGLVRERERQQRRLRRSKRHAMLWATLAVLHRPPLLDLRLELDGDVHECFAPFVFIGNNGYRMEGFDIGTRQRLDEGCLNVYTTRGCTTSGLIKLALHALFGRLRQAEDFFESHASALRVTSRKPRLLVATDGEVTPMNTPLEFRIRPRALEVLVP